MKKVWISIKSIFSLIRLPNLFTVPGDCVCGFLIGSQESFEYPLLFICASSLSYYIFGLISNDIVDLDEDKKNNPSRPIASGQISATSAKIASFLLIISGIAFSFAASASCGVVGFLLLGSIILYNFFFKSSPFLGTFLLASCRAFNVILGMAYFGLPIRIPLPQLTSIVGFIVFYFIYVFGFSVAARDERNSNKTSFIIGSCAIFLSLSFLFANFASKIIFIFKATGYFAPAFYSGLIAVALLYAIFALSWKNRILLKKTTIESDIAGLIRGMILVQTIFLSTNGFLYESWIILALFPFASLAGRLFKGS